MRGSEFKSSLIVKTMMNKLDYDNPFKSLSTSDENSMSQLVQLLSGVLRELQRGNVIAENVSRRKTYWTAEDIAYQIGKSKSTVQSRYTCKPSFPKARRLPSEKGKGHPVWMASEVMAWIEKHKER